MSGDTLDFFRQREQLAWGQFIASGHIEDLQAWRGALAALNGELQSRTRMLLERGFAHLEKTPVQTSGKEPSRAE